MALQPVFKKAYWTLAVGGLLYVLSLFALTNSTIQRHALYAHKVNPTYWQDISDVQQFGFLKGQVQPFHLKTPDNETLFAWHILPVHLYNKHASSLDTENLGPVSDHAQTSAFKLLASDPNARVVINFHGNAAHLASSYRPTTYTNLLSTSTPSHPVHILTLDYRGFGLSTGAPTEKGLITDALTLLTHLASTLSIPPQRILLIGQSLGTAVATAAAHHFSCEGKDPFAGLILVSGFSSIPRLLDSYSIKGVAPPILAPLRPYPRLQKYFRTRIADTWDTESRIADLVFQGVSTDKAGGTDITILHARDDWEIPWREGRAIFDAAVARVDEKAYTLSRRIGSETEVLDIGNGKVRVSWEKVMYGGHNRVVTFQVLAREVLRAFERNGF